MKTSLDATIRMGRREGGRQAFSLTLAKALLAREQCRQLRSPFACSLGLALFFFSLHFKGENLIVGCCRFLAILRCPTEKKLYRGFKFNRKIS